MRIGGDENLSFFELAILIFFFRKIIFCCIPIKISHKLTGYHKWDSIFMNIMISRKKLGGIGLWTTPLSLATRTKRCGVAHCNILGFRIHATEFIGFCILRIVKPSEFKKSNKCWQMTPYTECKGLFWNNQLRWLP